ncbi:MAG: glycoside hydrolase family 2 protein [Rikenellaceae bacterium]|nr:glycoside hydrolase family 2 protein [Rikenellaceae bacterium]
MIEMGVTAIRMANYPQDPFLFELCDRYGIVVWCEIPLIGQEFGTYNGFVNSRSFKENCKLQLTETIKQNYNHPSVMFWGLFTNLITRDDDPVTFIKDLNSLVKRLDDTRLTTASSNQDGGINFVTDVIGWSQYLGWREGSVSDVDRWLKQLRAEWFMLKSGIGEYGFGGSVTHINDTLRRPYPRERLNPERWQSRYHERFYEIASQFPSLWGTFINAMFDYGSINYMRGDSPGVKNLGLVTYDRRFKKDAFYFYKANWNDTEAFVYIPDKRWNERIDEIQNIRVYSNQTNVELIVNGKSQGVRHGTNGVFIWNNIRLSRGVNKLEAYSGRVSDSADIVIDPDLIR